MLADKAPCLLVRLAPCLARRAARLDPRQVLAPDNELPPQAGQVRQHAAEPAEVEELALAVGAVVVVHRHLGEAKAGAAIEAAVVNVINTKIKSLAAGKMGYGTREVGDLIAVGM